MTKDASEELPMPRQAGRHICDCVKCDLPITAAIRLAGTGGIASVHVVMNRRPTYAELVRYHQEAARCAVSLSIGASGITARPPKCDAGWGHGPTGMADKARRHD